jgi:ATP-dependent DNA helicase DinG
LVELQTSGPMEARSSAILEVGVVLLDAASGALAVSETLVALRAPLPEHITRQCGLQTGDFDRAPSLADVAGDLANLLRGRVLLAHDSTRVRHFLSRDVSSTLARAAWLDARDLLELTHPDAPGVEPGAYTEALLGRSARPRALAAALDLCCLLAAVARGAAAESPRYQVARSSLERYLPESPWLALLGKGLAVDAGEEPARYIEIESTPEAAVPFDEDAIAAVLADSERGRRYFPGYRARSEQIELARHFCRNLRDGGTLMLEGGTGVGKSLAYLAAAIPFVMQRAAAGLRGPVVISTRTKLLQDQLLQKDIAAAARMLGHGALQALSIKGRANYVCEKRLGETLPAGRDPSLLQEDRQAWAVMMACGRTRPGGEVGSLPAALTRRHPQLRDLVRGSVAQRAEQCSREECGRRPSCPFGRRRAALGRAHLVVANHDLLLRWPPDYPRLGHVIVDEGHELASVADDVYALVVRPDDLQERIDDIFGGPPGRGTSTGLLPRKQRAEAEQQVREARRALALDLAAIGRGVAARASEYGEVQLPAQADRHFPHVAKVADTAAARLDGLARLAEELDARAEWMFDEAPTSPQDGPTPVQKNAEALREGATGLRLAFSEGSPDVVAGFERLVMPYDRWVLAIRAVSPAGDFHQRFMEGLESFAAVSASLFIDGDAFAATGELEIEERSMSGVDKVSLPSPFDYDSHMRVVALPSPGSQPELVRETADVLALLARALGGRTLGLFTSLRRMNEVADLLDGLLADERIEVLAPRRGSDDPASLVRRFRALPAGGVLLGARTFWQGLDIAGDGLQAVVIEKLPFEVPTELRRRREDRLSEAGINAFERFRLGKMLLYLKQMTGRLIRSEKDRGIVVIVEGRSDRSYFGRLGSAFPPGTNVRVMQKSELTAVLSEVGLGTALTGGDSKS